jgi:soluble lytic murein transglycosylase
MTSSQYGESELLAPILPTNTGAGLRTRLLAVGLFAAGLFALGLLPGMPGTDFQGLGIAVARSDRQSNQKAVESLSADDAFVQARAAMGSENQQRFEQLAPKAAEHPLKLYINYWSLRLQLAERRSDSNTGLDAEVRKFIAANPATLVTDLLRRDWMLNLGRRGEWAMIESQYPLWVLQDDAQAHCYQLSAKAVRGEAVTAAARTLLGQTRELGEACVTLIETLIRTGSFKRDDVYRQLLQALEFNSANSIRRVAVLSGADLERIEQAISQPVRALTHAAGSREIEQIALSRLARQDTTAAAERLANSSLNPAEKQFAWSQIAAASMRKLEPEALKFTREALGGSSATNAATPNAKESSPIGDETLVWLARAALRAQDWNLLNAVVRRMSPVLQRDPAWVYWIARAHLAQGRKEASETLLKTIAGQFHFYGQLAAEELGVLTNVPVRASAATETELADIDRNEGIARAMEFYRLGLRMEGNREWNYQLRGMTDRSLLALADWACRRRILDRCVNTADRTQSEHDFALRFITPFHEELKPFAKDAGLDPAWVYGLIRQESRFLMDARSSVGASGLMQIMPATGRWIARKLAVSDFRVEQLSELQTNLRFGTFYLKSVFDDLEGSAVLASAAYNAGPNRPRNWRSTLPNTVEGAIFAEIIPFSETRDYVKKVLSNATFYSALFSGQPQSLKQRLGSVSPKAASPSELP